MPSEKLAELFFIGTIYVHVPKHIVRLFARAQKQQKVKALAHDKDKHPGRLDVV